MSKLSKLIERRDAARDALRTFAASVRGLMESEPDWLSEGHAVGDHLRACEHLLREVREYIRLLHQPEDGSNVLGVELWSVVGLLRDKLAATGGLPAPFVKAAEELCRDPFFSGCDPRVIAKAMLAGCSLGHQLPGDDIPF